MALNPLVNFNLNLVPVTWSLTILGVLALWFRRCPWSLLISGGRTKIDNVWSLQHPPTPYLFIILMLKTIPRLVLNRPLIRVPKALQKWPLHILLHLRNLPPVTCRSNLLGDRKKHLILRCLPL